MLLLVAFGVLAALAKGETPTFYKDVLPILQQRCQECHRPGEIAPFSLMTYAEARPWAKAIREAVLTRKMPPWFADSSGAALSGDRSLSEPQINVIRTWATLGAPGGDPKDAPSPTIFTDGWKIDKPDVIIDMGTDFEVPASGAVEYQYFVAHTNFKEDRFVSEIEVRPGNRSAVHHITVYARPPGSAFMSHVMPGRPFVADPGKPPARHPVQDSSGVVSGLDVKTDQTLAMYLPGGDAFKARKNQARLIKAGSDLIFEVHYTTRGKKLTDRSKIGLVFARERPAEQVLTAAVMNLTLHIPPAEPEHRLDAVVTLLEETKIQAISPHMHLRGKSFEMSAKYPSGAEKSLLRLKRYDFNWQQTYDFAQPVVLPKGTQLRITGFYDNSPNNPANPDPAKDVYWGNQTWEEMLVGFVDLAVPVDLNLQTLVSKEAQFPVSDPPEKSSVPSLLRQWFGLR